MEEPIRKTRAERMKEEGLLAHREWLKKKRKEESLKTKEDATKL
jgi:hypothetical protein